MFRIGFEPKRLVLGCYIDLTFVFRDHTPLSALQLIDPRFGRPTTWGFFDPASLNNNPEHYSERGENSLEICAWLASAYSVTGTALYRDTFWDLVTHHGYARNALNNKIDGSTDENHSDTELMFLAYHALYYANQRLPAAHPRKAELERMTALFDAGLERAWLLARDERSPLWLGIYAGTAGFVAGAAKRGQATRAAAPSGASAADVAAAAWSLRRWAVDLVNWPVNATGRLDTVVQPFVVRGSTSAPLMRDIRPPAERTTSQWNNDPFAIADGSGYSEYQPSVWTLPYWLMKFNGLI